MTSAIEILASGGTGTGLKQAAERFARAARAQMLRADEGGGEGIPEEVAEMLALIAEQPEWRLFVDGTRNLGHQAASVMLLRRLLALTRYEGRVTVVYADDLHAGRHRTPDKLALMFARLDPSCIAEATVAHGRCERIRFLPWERRAELREPVAFGFTGGADDMSVNYAAELQVRFFSRIQPYLWDDELSARDDPYYETSRIEQPDGRHLYPVDAWPAFRTLPLKPALCDADWTWFAETQDFDMALRQRTRSLRHILDAQRGGGDALCTWPLYGLQHFRDSAPEMFLACALCALRLQAVARRTVVLVSFSPHDEMPGWSVLVDALAEDIDAGDRSLPALAAALRLRCGQRHGPGAWSEEGLSAWVGAIGEWLHAHAAPGCRLGVHAPGSDMDIVGTDSEPRVHIAAIGIVPMDMFHQALAEGDFPCVIEGQGACNLMSGLGRPFLQVLRPEHVIKNSYAAAVAGADFAGVAERVNQVGVCLRELDAVAWVLASGRASSAFAYTHGLNRISSFMQQAIDVRSEVGWYFSAMGRAFGSDARDKQIAGIHALREVVLAQSAS